MVLGPEEEAAEGGEGESGAGDGGRAEPGFRRAQWVWREPAGRDEYLRFRKTFVAEPGEGDGLSAPKGDRRGRAALCPSEKRFSEGCVLRIACEGDYAAYLNGELLYTGQYSAPYGQIAYDELPLRVREGENELEIIACHPGIGSAVYRPAPPGVAFEAETASGRIVAASAPGEEAESVPEYLFAEEWISPQQGKGLAFDLRAGREAQRFRLTAGHRTEKLIPRPVSRCEFSLLPSRVAASGRWAAGGGNTPAEEIQNALLSAGTQGGSAARERTEAARGGAEGTGENASEGLSPAPETGAGISVAAGTGSEPSAGLSAAGQSWVLFDLGREETGYLTFRIRAEAPLRLLLGWGEHLDDLRPRCAVGGRNFAFSYLLDRGETDFTTPFKRVGGRYLIALLDGPAEILRLTVLGCLYPVEERGLALSDPLHRRIYETARRTNRLCMHTHYEDCPWREQALYGMDARFQMLFGYYLFGETRFARANLELMLSTQREDGLFDLCAPSEIAVTIPCFSLYILLALAEYAEFSGDEAFFVRQLPVAGRTIEAFLRRTEGGLVPRFTETPYWNFFEWTEGLDGGKIFRDRETERVFELPLNALLILTLRKLAERCAALGLPCGWGACADDLAERCEAFYSEEEGAYASFLDGEKRCGFHELTQCLMLNVSARHVEKLLPRVLEGRDPEVSVGALAIKYDGLLCRDPGLLDRVLVEIERIFGGMLFAGATSFWETKGGGADFEGAGSLCHAWSSVPAYVYHRYVKGETLSGERKPLPCKFTISEENGERREEERNEAL